MRHTTKHTRPDDEQYRRYYQRGWRWAQNLPGVAEDMGGLGYADHKGWTQSDAWTDGYTDFSIGLGVDRAKWHGWHDRQNTETDCECMR